MIVAPEAGIRAAESIARGEPAIVPVDGALRRFDSFDEMIVVWEEQTPTGALHREKASFEPPLRVTSTDQELQIVGGEGTSQFRWAQLESVIFRERAAERGLLLGGAAAVAAALVGGGTLAWANATHDEETDPHGNRLVYLPIAAGAAATGLTLLVMIPATGELGVEISPTP